MPASPESLRKLAASLPRLVSPSVEDLLWSGWPGRNKPVLGSVVQGRDL